MSDHRWPRLGERLKPHLGQLALLLVGFGVGSLIFGLRACSAPVPHAGHPERPAGGAASPATQIWTCSMHPQIRQPAPGLCPICGMDLIPVPSGEGAAASSPDRIILSERAQTLARLRTSPVRPRPDASAEVRLLGRLEVDETTLKTVTAWTGGRIERLHVNVTGQRVHAGQVIATLYSPEVFAAHQDLLVAIQQVGRLAQSPESSRQAAGAALEATRERLRLLGVPQEELARLETSEQPARAVPVRTPFAGTVTERVATEGAYITTGAALYRLANLNKLWLQLDAYESDLPRISVGQAVRIKVDAFPGDELEGRVTFIDPTLDASRRTARVRVALDNRDGRLRPGMFAEATVMAHARSEKRSPLVVPATAPLFTGRRAIVYVELRGDERVAYEPRAVRLGPRLGDFYPVVAGLNEGERVVTRGAFVIDADLQIRGGASMMSSPDDQESGPWDAAIKLPQAERARLAPILSRYLEVQRALAADDLQPAKTAADRLSRAVAAVKPTRPRAAAAAWSNTAQALSAHARHLAAANDLERARAGFEDLSEVVAALLRRFGNPLDQALQLAFCPMAFANQGASWIQQGAEIDNPYFGASMRRCGEVKQQIPAGAFLSSPKPPVSKRSATPAGGHQH